MNTLWEYIKITAGGILAVVLSNFVFVLYLLMLGAIIAVPLFVVVKMLQWALH